MFIKYLFLLSLAVLSYSLKNVQNMYDLRTQVEENEWSFLKVYSRDCGYCKQIEPVCIDLERENKNVTFLEIVGSEQKQFTLKFKISVFPTLFLFNRYFDLPVVHHGPRDKENLEGWIKYVTAFQLPKANELKDSPQVIYKGPRGKQYNLVKLLALRNIHTIYAWEPAEDSPTLMVGENNFTKFTSALQLEVLKANAQFSNFTQSTWYNIQVKKMNGIIFVNHHSSRQFNKLLNDKAKANPDIVFANIQPSDPNYLQILEYLSAEQEPAIFAILPARSGLYKLSKQITSQNLDQFIVGVRKENLIPHKKTQKSDNPYILTRENEHLIAQMPKDIILFLYDDRKPYTDKLLQLVNYIIAYLRSNPNIHVFVCNPLKNDLTLEVPVDPLPMVIFFKNNMKQHHIYFPHSQIGPQSILEFIQQNTTFDWVEPEEYGTSDEQQSKKEEQGQEGQL